MEEFFEYLKEPKLQEIRGSIERSLSPEKVTEKFDQIVAENLGYDRSFLWILCCAEDPAPQILKYIEANYAHFRKNLDSKFPKLMTKERGFISRMWEMILFDSSSREGKLTEKAQAGPDIQIEMTSGQIVQIESVAPDEANDSTLRSLRPVYDKDGFYSGGGDIEDLERPVILRFLQGFDEKAKDNKGIQTPFIIAINTYKVVGLISRDEYVLRRTLFGLGYDTITRKSDGTYGNGLQQNPVANKPGAPAFSVGRFRDPNYSHVSGVIYTSQNPTGLIPGGSGWHNSGIVYVPNPMATYPADVGFDFFKRINCNEQIYEELPEKLEFKSSVSI